MTESEADSGETTPQPPLLGKYEVGKLLGRGAFAKVYHAREVASGKSVAIKAVSKQKLAKAGISAATVKREIAAMRRLRHPNVVELIEVLATRTKVYFVMEFARGGELFAKIAKGRFSEDLCRRYFRQLISAVTYCHSRGVYHRDLKPENLLLDENWDLKVTDFGLSSVADHGGVSNAAVLHTLCGTPAYVAPEILAKKGYDGAKVDIWTCGIVLFVLAAGYLPFNDSNIMAMYRKIYRGEFRFPRWISPDLRRLISRLLDVNPISRITVDEISSDLWFNKGIKENSNINSINSNRDFHHHYSKLDYGGDGRESNLNAFDLISFSSGFNLSWLFAAEVSEERFVSAETAERVVERISDAAKSEGLAVAEGEEGKWRARISGGKGWPDFALVVEARKLTAELVVVEARIRETGDGKIWREKLWPKIQSLVFQPDIPVLGD